MIIKSIGLLNFGPFKGMHKLDLGPTVYGIVARRESDEASSNWAGKTTLLEAVGFALYGTHRHRHEDGWISKGERSGSVVLELQADGVSSIIERKRLRDKSTQLFFDGATGAEAQAAIERAVGLTENDYRATCYFEQKRMHRFVTADPGERMSIVTGWLALEKLAAAEQAARARLEQASQLEQRAIARVDALVSIEQQEAAARGNTDSFALETEQQTLVVLVGQLEAEATKLAGWRRDAEQAARYPEIVREGKTLKASSEPPVVVEAELEMLKLVLDVVQDNRRTAIADWRQKQTLAAGEFGGVCPVADMPCPVTDEINSKRRRNLKLHNEAEARYGIADAECTRVSQIVAGVRARLTEAQRASGRLTQLREQAIAIKPLAEQVAQRGVLPDAGEHAAQLSHARTRLEAITVQLGCFNAAVASAKQRGDELLRLREVVSRAAAITATCREAARIFGRNGAQRRVAEGALGGIERAANRLLSDCGADLSIAVTWAREGKGLASECEACGAPFPASAKTKSCARCQAERGPKLVSRLDLELSDRSGAAEDLAGAAFQLAASAWLRGARGAQFATALIDEPFGALDKKLRAGFARHLARGLGVLGTEQAFVVAHQRDVIDSLPGRIEVVSEGGWSRIERVVG